MRAYKKMMDMEVDPLEAPRELRAGQEEGAYLIAHAAHWLWRLGLAVKRRGTQSTLGDMLEGGQTRVLEETYCGEGWWKEIKFDFMKERDAGSRGWGKAIAHVDGSHRMVGQQKKGTLAVMVEYEGEITRNTILTTRNARKAQNGFKLAPPATENK